MKKLSLSFFIMGIFLIISSFNPSITGAIIGTEVNLSRYALFVFGLTLMCVSSIMYLRSKSLEAIIIPTGGNALNEKRIKAAMEDYASERGDKPYVLVPGLIDRDSKGRVDPKTQQYKIYKELRDRYNLKPSDMIIEGKSTDTLENFLYSLDKLKKKNVNHLRIATSPTQYWRFKLFEDEAKEEGLIDESFRINPIYTRETLYEFLYGVMAYAKDYLRVKSSDSLEEARRQKTGVVGKAIKKFLRIGKSW